MANELGQMKNDSRKTPNEGETIVEFYNRIRGNEITELTKNVYESAYDNIKKFVVEERDLKSDINVRKKDKQILDLTADEVTNWCRWMLNEQKLAPRTAENYLQHMVKMISDLKSGNYIGGQAHPFRKVSDSNPFDYDSGAVWPEIPYDRLSNAIRSIKHPQKLALITTLAKTGVRRGEASNLDERDVNIDHPVSQEMDTTRREIASKPNTIYIDSSISKGEVHNGEERRVSNKKKSHRAIPIDDELVDILSWYIACRPRSDMDSKPLFTNQQKQNRRVSGTTIYDIVTDFQENNGLGGNMSITPHFFRHFYTTQVRNSLSTVNPKAYPGTPKQIVKGLRGDSDSDTIETYSHDWDEGLEEDVCPTDDLIRDCIPKFFN